MKATRRTSRASSSTSRQSDAGTPATKEQPQPKSQQYTGWSIIEHVRNRDFWAGSHEPIPQNIAIFARIAQSQDSPRASKLTAHQREFNIAPSLIRCIDEPIVNAIDQAKRCARTTEIRISVTDDARIIITNNGDGIPIAQQPGANMMIPQYIFGVPLTGSNLGDTKSSSFGGVNGIGVKITNILSREFIIDTHDAHQSYHQVWTNGMTVCNPPQITPRASIDGAFASGTRVEFLLDFEHFRANPRDIEPITFSRAIFVLLYLRTFLPRVRVFWNEEPLDYSARDIIDAILAPMQNTRQIAPSAQDTTAYETIVDTQSNATYYCMPCASQKFTASVINGIVVPDGNHFTRVSALIKANARAQLARLLGIKEADLSAQNIRALSGTTTKYAIVIVLCAQNVHWTSQSKDHAQFTQEDLAAQIKPSARFIAQIGEIVAQNAFARLSQSQREKKSTISVPSDKYTSAQRAGSVESAKCSLFLVEGDSAMSHVGQGLSRNCGFQYYGMLSLGGVIPNVRKEARIIANARGASTGAHASAAQREPARYQVVTMSKKLETNVFMRTFFAVTGLDPHVTYNDKRDIEHLRYGHVIGAVDQDLDGTGNIFSLIISMFEYLWPALIRAGYVQRLATPIMRAYPIARRTGARRTALIVEEFYSEREYEQWIALNPDYKSRFKIEYYKGLGTNSPDEMDQIIRNLRVRSITYREDSASERMCYVYMGPEPETRKQQLSRERPPIIARYEDERDRARTMPVTYHMLTEAHSYQLDNLSRKLNCVIDGANQVSRKIINGILTLFAQSRDKQLVASLAGAIQSTNQYHHGAASMEESITHRAFIAPGGVQIPYLVPCSNFGSRYGGGSDAAKPRYIHTKLNHMVTRHIFNSEDYAILPAQFSDGKRCEPRFFLPIVPMILLETVTVPGHGWNISVYAREFVDVLANLRTLIKTDGRASVVPMRPCVYPCGEFAPQIAQCAWDDDGTRIICDAREMNTMWHGVIIQCASDSGIPETWSIGTYEWISETTILVTELPLCVWTKSYIAALEQLAAREDSIIESVDGTPSDPIEITVTLNTSARQWPLISQYQSHKQIPNLNDPIIRALKLRARMADNINLHLGTCIQHFDTYEEVLQWWFKFRRPYYAERIARNIDLMRARIIYGTNLLRYIDTRADHITLDMDDARALEHLRAREYVQIYVAAFENGALKYERDVSAIIFGPAASYDYILDVRDRDKTSNARDAFSAKLERWKAELAQIEDDARIDVGFPFIGAKIWLHELEQLEKAVVEGRRTKWQYSNYGRFHFK